MSTSRNRFLWTIATPTPPTASLAALHFVDCTESNDEEDGEEEEEEVRDGGRGATAKARSTADPGDGSREGQGRNRGVRTRVPSGTTFFHADSLALPDSQGSQGSLASLSQSCCSAPSTSSPVQDDWLPDPELFSDPESTDEAFGGPDKPPSNPGGLGQGPTLPDTLILRSKQQQEEEGGAKSGPQREGGDCQENLPDSQTSSDFDIPCTPESQAPKAEELSQLYRTLASGEEVAVLGTGRQRSM
ncbi:hypothetical protein CRUP_008581 [Coryphaenoides rupestris]|nr:hypothetical protein CRUP_008581 [Coryphaenoides rupestris]